MSAESPAARCHRSFETFDEYNEVSQSRGWDVEWRALETGCERIRWDSCRTGTMSLLRLRTGLPFDVEYGSTPTTPMYVPVGSTGVHLNGGRLEGASIAVIERGGGGYFGSPNPLDILEIVVPKPTLSEFSPGTGVWRVDPSVWRQSVKTVVRGLDQTGDAKQVGHDEVEDSMLRLLATASGPRASARTAAIVAAAREAVNEGRYSVDDLVVVAGVSRASLYRAFEAELGTSPHRWLQHRRLHELRRRLRDRSYRDWTITDLAADLGIGHLGRMAGTYRSRFGELPRETRSDAVRRIG